MDVALSTLGPLGPLGPHTPICYIRPPPGTRLRDVAACGLETTAGVSRLDLDLGGFREIGDDDIDDLCHIAELLPNLHVLRLSGCGFAFASPRARTAFAQLVATVRDYVVLDLEQQRRCGPVPVRYRDEISLVDTLFEAGVLPRFVFCGDVDEAAVLGVLYETRVPEAELGDVAVKLVGTHWRFETQYGWRRLDYTTFSLRTQPWTS